MPTQTGQACYLPNTWLSHASYAINRYYEKNSNFVNSCNFQRTTTITMTDPSYQNCNYPSSTHLDSRQSSSTNYWATGGGFLLLSNGSSLGRYVMKPRRMKQNLIRAYSGFEQHFNRRHSV